MHRVENAEQGVLQAIEEPSKKLAAVTDTAGFDEHLIAQVGVGSCTCDKLLAAGWRISPSCSSRRAWRSGLMPALPAGGTVGARSPTGIRGAGHAAVARRVDGLVSALVKGMHARERSAVVVVVERYARARHR